MDRRESTKANKAPQLGIFWLVEGELVIDSSPLSEGEPFGNAAVTHTRDHIDVWSEWQRIGKVPPDAEYEEYPRGRVTYNRASGEFVIRADKCILSRKGVVAQIKAALHLPKDTKTEPDDHYRCHVRLYGTDADAGWARK